MRIIQLALLSLLTGMSWLAVAENLVPQNLELDVNADKYAESHPNQYHGMKATAESQDHIDMLEEDPRLVILWAAYGFSKDYNSPRGHFYTLTDVRETLRTGAPKDAESGPMPAACWTCKGTDIPRMLDELGDEFFEAKWAARGPEMMQAIGCGDCHDKDFNLHVSRPFLHDALKAHDIEFDKASDAEKSSMVCGQCHNEYYFRKPGNIVTLPMQAGFTAEDAEGYYDSFEFKDWTHGLSKAPMLKAQHPGYELFRESIHARKGLSCADCHMGQTEVNGETFTNHQIDNPLEHIADRCLGCHRSEKQVLTYVSSNKEDLTEAKSAVEDTLVKAHFEAAAAWEAGATEDEMKPALMAIRSGQWNWDWAIASHGAHVHNIDAALTAMDKAQAQADNARAELKKVLAKHGVTGEVAIPDISTKAKAQAALGMDMDTMNAEKAEFLKTTVPAWEAEYEKKHGKQ